MNENFTADGVIYARYSSHSQRDVSIEQQLRACRAFAERLGIRIVKTYEDRALTGTSDKRPGFQQMIRDARSSGWNYVVVYTLDRFARDRYDSAVYKRQLKNCGVKVLSAMENISDDPTGVLMESLLEGLAEYYSKELSRKVRRGHEDNARKCMVNGMLGLGFCKAPDGRYAINEAEAATVLEAFTRVSNNEPFVSIAEDFNARGIPTRKGRKWTRTSMYHMLTNERYAGVYLYDGMRIPDGIPRIVPQDIFDSVQCILHSKPNARRDPSGRTPQKRRRENGTYLLTGKLFCGHCGSPMIGVSGTSHTAAPHFYYTCKGRRSDHTSCSKRNVRRDAIEEFIATALRDTMLTPDAVQTLADAAMQYQLESSVNHELESLRSRLADTNRALGNLTNAIEAGIFSATTQARLGELEAQKRELQQLLRVAEADTAELMTREEIIAALELFQTGDVTDKDYQEALIDTFLVAAYVYDDKIKFLFTLGGAQKHTTIPFDPLSIDLSASPEVRITGEPGDQKSGDHPRGRRIFICVGIRKAGTSPQTGVRNSPVDCFLGRGRNP